VKSHERGILERIARNLPTIKLKFGQVKTDRGPIYFAWGNDYAGRYYGVWGGDVVVDEETHSIARDLEFKNGTTEKDVRQTLIDDAYGALSVFDQFGIFKQRQRSGEYDA